MSDRPDERGPEAQDTGETEPGPVGETPAETSGELSEPSDTAGDAHIEGAETAAKAEDAATRPVVPRRRSRRRWRLWLAIGVLVIIATAVWMIFRAVNGDSSTATYTTKAAEKGTLAVTVEGSGYVYAAKTASVSPKISGTVSGLRVATGRKVEEGDLLFYIENDDLDTAETKALASYRSSKEAVDQARAQLLEREQQLYELENPSETDTKTPDPTESDREIARERVDAAEHGLSAAKASRDAGYKEYEKAVQDQGYRRVEAPMDGVITEVNIVNGDSVSGGGTSSSAGAASAASGSTGGNQTSGASASSSGGDSSSGTGSSSAPIVISDMRSLYAQVPVNEVDVTSLKRRQKVTSTFDAVPGLTITGKVGRISPAGTSSQGVVTFNVNVSFDVQSNRLKPGMTVSASIVTALARDAVLVPNAAIQTQDGQSYVRVLDDARGTGTPRTVQVKTGLANDTTTQISSGLKSGEHVVTGDLSTQSTSGTGTSGGGFRLPGMGGSRQSGGGTRQSGGGPGGP